MALDRAGFFNVGEFYSPHYLDEVLEGDLQGLRKSWDIREKETGIKSPAKRLHSLTTRYLAGLSAAEHDGGDAERLERVRDLHAHLLESLGYSYAPEAMPLDDGTVVPVLFAEVRDGRPYLWAIEASLARGEDDDPLDQKFFPSQLPSGSAGAKVIDATFRELFDDRLFAIEHPPRWVIFLAGRDAMLIDRLKWAQGKHLRFDLLEIFGRHQSTAFEVLACLLHKDVLNPSDGSCLHDTLDENSHRHAYAVSTDLKKGARKAVELLANEVVWYRREVQHLQVFQDDAFADKLKADCLTYLYRLLFLFYVEARGVELGVVSMNSDSYRMGYSLEFLRDFELQPLTSPDARDGFFLSDSLDKLFTIVYRGFPESRAQSGELLTDGFLVDPLRGPLFDPDKLAVLRNVRLRNHVVQEVIQLLSLSEERGRRDRGRISYANLGINQLGSVYEGLLSYSGFFAKEDLYEVQAEGDANEEEGSSEARVAAFDTDKSIAELEPQNVKRIKAWRKEIKKPFAKDEVKSLERLSARIDGLWAEHVKQRQELRQALREPVQIWGQAAPAETRWKSVEEAEELASASEKGTAPGRRLCAVMDYWCALWFWPIQEAELLPSRDEWLLEVESILEGNLEEIACTIQRVGSVSRLGTCYRFQHWEAEFVNRNETAIFRNL